MCYNINIDISLITNRSVCKVTRFANRSRNRNRLVGEVLNLTGSPYFRTTNEVRTSGTQKPTLNGSVQENVTGHKRSVLLPIVGLQV